MDTRTSYVVDSRTKTAAVERLVEIVGEAAANISAQRQQGVGGIPWTQVTGMRNRLAEAYMIVNSEVLWRTISEDLPTVIRVVEPKPKR